MIEILLVVLGIVALGAYSGRGRVWEMMQAKYLKAQKDIQKSDPLALFQFRIAKGEEKIKQGEIQLCQISVSIRQARGRVAHLEEEWGTLDTIMHTDPTEENAREMVELESRLATLRATYENRLSQYATLLATVKEAVREIETAKDEAKDLEIELNSSISQDEISAIVSQDLTQGLQEARDMTQHSIAAYQSRIEVQQEIHGKPALQASSADIRTVIARYQPAGFVQEAVNRSTQKRIETAQ